MCFEFLVIMARPEYRPCSPSEYQSWEPVRVLSIVSIDLAPNVKLLMNKYLVRAQPCVSLKTCPTTFTFPKHQCKLEVISCV